MINLSDISDGFYIIHFKNANSSVIILQQGETYSGNLETIENDTSNLRVWLDETEITMVEQISLTKYKALQEATTIARRTRDMQSAINFKQIYEAASNMGVVANNISIPSQSPAPVHQMKKVEEKPIATNIKPTTIGEKKADGVTINLPLKK